MNGVSVGRGAWFGPRCASKWKCSREQLFRVQKRRDAFRTGRLEVAFTKRRNDLKDDCITVGVDGKCTTNWGGFDCTQRDFGYREPIQNLKRKLINYKMLRFASTTTTASGEQRRFLWMYCIIKIGCMHV